MVLVWIIGAAVFVAVIVWATLESAGAAQREEDERRERADEVAAMFDIRVLLRERPEPMAKHPVPKSRFSRQ